MTGRTGSTFEPRSERVTKATTTTFPSAIADHVVRGRAAANVLLVVGASLFIALAAQIAVPLPFTPVPMTMQPLAVLLVGVVLGSNRGAATAMLYLLEGFSGMPVFAQGHGGAMWAMAATAGFLWSYPLAAWVAGRFSELNWGATTLRAVVGMVAALAVIYIGGWSWLSILTTPAVAFATGVAPFVIADIVKVAIAAALLPYAHQLIHSIHK
jgi:biotin transport system substrate-specific component